eukprot:m.265593 g.265593  ORF g.265593 m.265593 type:complete len:86 (+) comp40489_c0_seq1:66-323(+)
MRGNSAYNVTENVGWRDSCKNAVLYLQKSHRIRSICFRERPDKFWRQTVLRDWSDRDWLENLRMKKATYMELLYRPYQTLRFLST